MSDPIGEVAAAGDALEAAAEAPASDASASDAIGVAAAGVELETLASDAIGMAATVAAAGVELETLASDAIGVAAAGVELETLASDAIGVAAADGHAAGGCLIVFAGANEEGHTADVHRLSLPSADVSDAVEAASDAPAEGGPSGALPSGALAWDCPKCTGLRPSPREMHIASLLPSSRLLVVHGGRSGDAVLCDVCILNVATWVWSAPIDTPCQRVGHACALVAPPPGAPVGGGGDGRLLLFGGFSGATFCNDTWEVCPTGAAGGDLCERLPAQESPARRFAHTMASLGEVLFVFGGSGGSDELDDLHEVDVAKTLAASVPPPA